jgi:hypothetical protein
LITLFQIVHLRILDILNEWDRSTVPIGPERAPTSVFLWVVPNKLIYAEHITHLTLHLDPEDGDTMYLRNVGNTAHIHTV